MVTEPCSQFIQLQMWEPEMAEAAFVQELRVFTCTSQPGGDGRLSKAEDPLRGGRIQSFGQRREHYGDLVGGSFQTVQRSVAPGAERGAASLAAKGLDAFGLVMLAITNECMNVSIGDPAVPALRVGTSEPCGVDPFGGSSATFHFRPGAYRRRRSPSTRRGRGGETTGRAIKRGAWFEETVDHGVCGLRCHVPEAMRSPVTMPKPGQAKQEAKREQEQEGRKSHTDPRSL
jgi:hypothetical protein